MADPIELLFAGEPRTTHSVHVKGFIAVHETGDGRSVFSSDCGPHWCPPEFVAWEGYPKLWLNIATWPAKR
jgi:uncharacterized membrane protein